MVFLFESLVIYPVSQVFSKTVFGNASVGSPKFNKSEGTMMGEVAQCEVMPRVVDLNTFCPRVIECSIGVR